MAGSHAPWTRYVLQQYPHLWSVIADFPELIKYDGCPPLDDWDEEEEDYDDTVYRDGITNMLMAHNFLSMQEE